MLFLDCPAPYDSALGRRQQECAKKWKRPGCLMGQPALKFPPGHSCRVAVLRLLRAASMKGLLHNRKASDRRLVRPTLRGTLLGLEIGTSQSTLPVGGWLIWENPTYSAFWRVFGVACLRLQRLASSVGF